MIYAPIEYFLLWEYNKPTRPLGEKGFWITYNAIETLALSSSNEAFKTIRYRKALSEFRRFGFRPKKKVKWNLTDAVQYAKRSYYIMGIMERCTE